MSSGTRKRRAAESEQVASSSKGEDAETLASSSKIKATSGRNCTEAANEARSSAHVPGSKMSAAKHSGLLAQDVATCAVAKEEAGVGAKLPSVHIADENGGITGRQLYAIAPRRSAKAKSATGNDSQRPQATSSTRPTSAQKEVPQEGKGKRRRQVEEPDESEESDYQLSEDEADSVARQLNRAGGGEVDVAESMLEDYFSAHGGGAGPTSDHTLARLACPKMDAAAVRSALQTAPQAFHEDFRTLYEEHLNLFSYWLFQMSAGFNVILYGLGSKRELIDGFRNKKLADSTHLVVNGYFPGLTMKQVLHTLSCDLLSQVGTFKNHSEHAKSICRALEENQGEEEGEGQGDGCVKEVFLVVHNIDGPSLRSEKAQTPLSILAQSPHVHVLASIDHINASLVWDQGRLSRFNWLWHDVTTYEPYLEETSYENSLMVKQSGALALSGLRHVIQSLTPNAQGIFKLIVGYHLECGSQTGYQGFPFHDCYMQCRERFLVNSELTLRTQLTEFCDHKLVRCRHGNDGVEYLLVPVDNSTLVEFLEEEEKKG